jgi:ribokinase
MAGRGCVCVVGSLHFDIMVRAPYLPRTGETLMGEAWWWKPGGKGGNQAMAAARHGAVTRLVGRLGDDDFGARLRERLAAASVDLAHVRTTDRGSGMSVAIVESGGDYAAIVVAGADDDLDEAQVADSAAAIRDSQVLLIQNEIAESSDVAAARIARAAGTIVVLNAAPARPMGALAGLVDVLVVNTVEAEMLGAGNVDGLARAAEAALTFLAAAPTVIVTVGAAGVAAASGAETWAIPGHAMPRDEAHGAGDVFVGALGARLAAADPLPDALRYANAAAALHVGTPESERPTLGPSDVQTLLDSHPRDAATDPLRRLPAE